MLGLPPGETIDVDASGSMPNTDGTAFLGRLRMRLGSEGPAVLAHETVHVVAQRVAGAERDWLWQAASVLNEGLASWIETRFRERLDRTDERLLVLAAMHSRRSSRSRSLPIPERLETVRDPNLKYGAGEALIAALVRLYGEAALARLLQAFDYLLCLPSDLRGLQLWQSTFQIAGFDLAAVVDEFYRGISEYAALNADRVAELPAATRRARAPRAHDRRHACPPSAAREPPAGVQLRHALSARAGQPVDRVPAVSGDAESAGLGSRGRDIAGGRVCVQPGVNVGAEVLYEPWDVFADGGSDRLPRRLAGPSKDSGGNAAMTTTCRSATLSTGGTL